MQCVAWSGYATFVGLCVLRQQQGILIITSFTQNDPAMKVKNKPKVRGLPCCSAARPGDLSCARGSRTHLAIWTGTMDTGCLRGSLSRGICWGSSSRGCWSETPGWRRGSITEPVDPSALKNGSLTSKNIWSFATVGFNGVGPIFPAQMDVVLVVIHVQRSGRRTVVRVHFADETRVIK